MASVLRFVSASESVLLKATSWFVKYAIKDGHFLHVDEFKSCLNAFFEERKQASSHISDQHSKSLQNSSSPLANEGSEFVPCGYVPQPQIMPMPYISGLESGGEWRQIYWSATNHNTPTLHSLDGPGMQQPSPVPPLPPQAPLTLSDLYAPPLIHHSPRHKSAVLAAEPPQLPQSPKSLASFPVGPPLALANNNPLDPLQPIAAGLEFSGKWRASSWNDNMGPIPLFDSATSDKAAPPDLPWPGGPVPTQPPQIFADVVQWDPPAISQHSLRPAAPPPDVAWEAPPPPSLAPPHVRSLPDAGPWAPSPHLVPPPPLAHATAPVQHYHAAVSPTPPPLPPPPALGPKASSPAMPEGDTLPLRPPQPSAEPAGVVPAGRLPAGEHAGLRKAFHHPAAEAAAAAGTSSPRHAHTPTTAVHNTAREV